MCLFDSNCENYSKLLYADIINLLIFFDFNENSMSNP